jgi:hypothetical protein
MGNFVDEKAEGDVALKLFLVYIDLRIYIVGSNEVCVEE